jgi:hypothetical protein
MFWVVFWVPLSQNEPYILYVHSFAYQNEFGLWWDMWETCQGDIARKILAFLDYWGLVQSSWYVCFAESGFGECWSEIKQAGCYWGTTQPNFSYRLSIRCRILPWLSMLFFIGGSKFHKCTSWIKVWIWTNAQELQRLALLWGFLCVRHCCVFVCTEFFSFIYPLLFYYLLCTCVT